MAQKVLNNVYAGVQVKIIGASVRGRCGGGTRFELLEKSKKSKLNNQNRSKLDQNDPKGVKLYLGRCPGENYRCRCPG